MQIRPSNAPRAWVTCCPPNPALSLVVTPSAMSAGRSTCWCHWYVCNVVSTVANVLGTSHGLGAGRKVACSACSLVAWMSARRLSPITGSRSCWMKRQQRSIRGSCCTRLWNTTSTPAPSRPLGLLHAHPRTCRFARWCSKPGCDHAVEYPPGGMRDIECRCGHVFCFACGMEPHRPAVCELVRQCVLAERVLCGVACPPNLCWPVCCRTGGMTRTPQSPRTSHGSSPTRRTAPAAETPSRRTRGATT